MVESFAPKLLLISFAVKLSLELSSCPADWTSSGSNCYSRRSNKKEWDDAENDCESLGGHLVSITTDDENGVVYGLRKNKDIWIGLNDKGVEGKFEWVDGTNSSYTNWANREPRKNGDCVKMASNKQWKAISCSDNYRYVCEKPAVYPTTQTPTTQASTIASCQAGWTRSALSCYSRFPGPENWETAESNCIQQGGHLASVLSDNENSAVLSLRGKSPPLSSSSDVWIGLNDKAQEGTFVWIDGTKNSSYTNWDTSISEPDGSGNCVRMVSNGTWRDRDCTRQYPYVCEYQLTIPSITMTSASIVTTVTATTESLGPTTAPQKQTTTSAATGLMTTIAATTQKPTTERSSTTAATTQKQTTALATTELFRTVAVTQKPTTTPATAEIITTVTMTTQKPTTVPPTTPLATISATAPQKQTTTSATTEFMTTIAATTQEPTTARATTPVASTAQKPTTAPVTTMALATTSAQATDKHTTAPSTTSVPSTAAATIQQQSPFTYAHPRSTTTTVASTIRREIGSSTSESQHVAATSSASVQTAAVSPYTTNGLSSYNNTQASTTLSPTSVTQVLANDKANTTTATGTASTPKAQLEQTSSSNTLYAGVGAAIFLCVALAVIVFVLVVRRRRKDKFLLTSHNRHHLTNGSASPFSAVNAMYDSDSFRTRGSTEDVELHSTITTTVINEPNQSAVDAPVGEDGYLVCRFNNRGEKNKVEFRRTEALSAEGNTYIAPSIVTPADSYEIPVATSTRNQGNPPADRYEVLFSTSMGREDRVQANRVQANSAEQRDRRSCKAQDQRGNETRMKPTELPNPSDGPSCTEDEDKYWEPASTEKELYDQLENRKFRQINRSDVTDRKEIGSGEFGVVEKAQWQMTRDKKIVVAVKTLSGTCGKDDSVKFLREATINGQFRHKNVVRLHGVVTAGSRLMLVLEFMSNGDLKDYLVKQSPEYSGQPCSADLPATLVQMCRDIASGMKYLARKLFVHRDLAARNILLNEELTCKIGDFGMARDVSDDNYYVTKGGKVPIRWCAPETWNYKKFSSASDVWSYGVLLYEIWSVGQRPFGDISNHKVMTKVESGYRLPPPPGCSRCFYHLMIDCWNPDSHERPSFGNILQRLASSDKSLTTNGQREPAIVGNLGDELDVSRGCYMYKDLRGVYGWK